MCLIETWSFAHEIIHVLLNFFTSLVGMIIFRGQPFFQAPPYLSRDFPTSFPKVLHWSTPRLFRIFAQFQFHGHPAVKARPVQFMVDAPAFQITGCLFGQRQCLGKIPGQFCQHRDPVQAVRFYHQLGLAWLLGRAAVYQACGFQQRPVLVKVFFQLYKLYGIARASFEVAAETAVGICFRVDL